MSVTVFAYRFLLIAIGTICNTIARCLHRLIQSHFIVGPSGGIDCTEDTITRLSEKYLSYRIFQLSTQSLLQINKERGCYYTYQLNDDIGSQKFNVTSSNIYPIFILIKFNWVFSLKLTINYLISLETATDVKKKENKNRYLWILRILLSVYAILYILFIVDFHLPVNDLNFRNTENIALIILFPVFTAGYIISWKNVLVSGVIFIIWFIGMCFENFFLCTRDCGAGIGMGIPLLILSILFIVYVLRKTSWLSQVTLLQASLPNFPYWL